MGPNRKGIFLMQKQYTQSELNMRAKAYYDNHFNHVHHAHIDIAGDLVAGTLLSRIMWWFAPTPDGKTKLRVFKDGHWWLAKNREDWWDEIRITAKQYDRAIKILEQKKLVIKKLFKFDGNPTTHIRLNFEQLESELEKWLNDIKEKMVKGEIDEKGRKTNFPKGKKPEVSTPELDLPWENLPNEDAEHQEYQGESPNPLGDMVFPQTGKTELPNGKSQNSQNGHFFNRDNIQGEHNRENKEQTGNTNNPSVVENVVGNRINEYKKAICHFFEIEPDMLDEYELSDEEIMELEELAIKHGKDLVDCIFATYRHAVDNEEEIGSLYGAFQHAIIKGWRKKIKARPKGLKTSSGKPKNNEIGYSTNIEFSSYDWVNKP